MRKISKVKKVIIKIGSSSLVKNDLSINEPVLISIMSQFKKLKDNGISPCLVTSGAVALGMHELKLDKKPSNMSLKQACAAVGQAKLMEYYNKSAEIYGLTLGQILVSHDDFQVRKRMVYLSNTLDSMFKNDIIPIINENDALSVDEIKVGDNDTLASLIAPMINADILILFSDIDGLYDKNPKKYNDAKLISLVDDINEEILSYASDSSSNVGTGGMNTKLDAALISTTAGVNMIICNSNKLDNLIEIINGEEIGTLFLKKKNIHSRDHWIIFKTKSIGSITVDDGCKNILNDKKVSILPKGIISVSGIFNKGNVIEVKSKDGVIIAKGISNYSNTEIDLIKGENTDKIKSILGYEGKSEVIHANDLVNLRDDIYGHIVK